MCGPRLRKALVALVLAGLPWPVTAQQDTRRFDGATDDLTLGLGATAIGVQSQAWLFKIVTDVGNTILFADGSGSGTSVFRINDGTLRVTWGASFADTSAKFFAADGWVIFVTNKASGTATPRMHKWTSGSGWTHEDGSAAVADAPTSSTHYVLGELSGGNNMHVDLLLGAIYSVNAFASDGAAEALGGACSDWEATTPSSLWAFDQASALIAVVDSGANVAHQTGVNGTSVVNQAGPSGFTMNCRRLGPPRNLLLGVGDTMLAGLSWFVQRWVYAR